MEFFKSEPDIVRYKVAVKDCQTGCALLKQQESQENRSSFASSNGQSASSVLEQGPSAVDDTSNSSTANVRSAPLCHQFWKAGNCNDGFGFKVAQQNGKNHLHVHPMFLHSNATSHKWIFGAIAELLDNAVDEIQNGATYVIVDKLRDPINGSPALLIQDDGGGMDPETIRQCMSFGFSEKKSTSAIGQYGNGFKTSTMRLGADAIVFSCSQHDRVSTRSVGLLSYTFLTQTGHDRVVVPMVDYLLDNTSGNLEALHRYGKEQFKLNLATILNWSPFSTEAELLEQFNGVGSHGTKVIIYNLWFNDDGNLELDFNTNVEDILISGNEKMVHSYPDFVDLNKQHIARRLHHSLRAYISILYMRMPASFQIVLRGKVVEHHNLASDLKFPEFIVYRPHSNGCKEGEVITTIGFLKDAPNINIHGFNVYHKNRLILPFWQVASIQRARGRGVSGVLEANFVKPIHNKQDFERTSLFEKLEIRLKEMSREYWDYHCGLIGYHVSKKSQGPGTKQVSSHPISRSSRPDLVMLNHNSPIATCSEKTMLAEVHPKRKTDAEIVELSSMKRRMGLESKTNPDDVVANELKEQEVMNLMLENSKLHSRLLEHERRTEEALGKVRQLRSEIAEVGHQYGHLMTELKSLGVGKLENMVHL